MSSYIMKIWLKEEDNNEYGMDDGNENFETLSNFLKYPILRVL